MRAREGAYANYMTAAEWFVEGLKQRGVTWMATLCGHGLNPLYHAARQGGLRLIDTRNEQTASYIAGHYGRLMRRPGICAVSSGVAHANALTGLTDAWFDGAPMLLITGAGALRTAGMGHFQDLDQVALARPVTTYARTIDCAERVVEILDEAVRQSGPSHITFPMDIQTTEVAENALVAPSPCRPVAPSASVSELERALAKAQRPLVVAGSGAHYGCGEADLLAFAERFSIPLVTPIWDRGIVDRPSPVFLGVIGAATGGPRLLADADCIVMAGAQPDYRVEYLRGLQAAIVRIDAGWSRLGALSLPGWAHWLREAQRRRDEFRAKVRKTGEEQARKGQHAIHVIGALEKVLTDDTLLLIDGGSIGQWAHQLLTDRYPSHWLTCGRSGVVGWGIAGAMAARLAYPDRPVILLSGDGAFTFTVAEIECAVRQGLHFVALVADDQAWGITQTGHLREFGEAISSTLGPIAFDRLAESLGARGRRATSTEAIESELRDALERPEVTVIHVPVAGGTP